MLIGLILIVELAVVSWLPRELSKRQLWARATLQQRTMLLADDVRARLGRWPQSSDALTVASVEVLRGQADSMVAYMRSNLDLLTPEQLRVLLQQARSHRMWAVISFLAIFVVAYPAFGRVQRFEPDQTIVKC